jgi:hypothetical protein
VAGGSWLEPLTAMTAAFVFGQALAWTYEYTYQGLSYSRGFSHTIVLVCLSASILVLSMAHSLIAGLGLFGVLSMIRFRTDLKTPRDLVFIMGSATVGVACGVNAIVVATLGAVSFSLISLYLYTGPFGSRDRFDGVLRFHVPAASTASRDLAGLLNRHCRRLALLSVTDSPDGAARELVYQVKFFRRTDHQALLDALREDHGAQDTRLLLQEATAEF